jgi:hypothetical protein
MMMFGSNILYANRAACCLRRLIKIQSFNVQSPRLQATNTPENLDLTEHRLVASNNPKLAVQYKCKIVNQKSAEAIGRAVSALLANSSAKPEGIDIHYHKPLGRGFLGTVYLGSWHENYVCRSSHPLLLLSQNSLSLSIALCLFVSHIYLLPTGCCQAPSHP